MLIPDPASIDTAKSYVVKGETYKEMIVVLHSLFKMTNNNPNVLHLQTVNICVGNTVMKMDVIGSDARLGI